MNPVNWEKATSTYGFDTREYWHDLKSRTDRVVSVETQNFNVFLYRGDGLLEGDVPRYFIMFDDAFEPDKFAAMLAELADTGKFAIEQNVTPLCYIPPSMSFEDWVKRVKTAPGYWRGEKFTAQTITQQVTNINELTYANSVAMKALQTKLQVYPDSSLVSLLSYFKACARHNSPLVYQIHSHVGNEWLWSSMYVTRGNSVYCPFIASTNDTELKNKYKPLLVGHIETTRQAKFHNPECTIEYGLAFGYKKILGFETRWLPGLATL